jgi:hypothetical protein
MSIRGLFLASVLATGVAGAEPSGGDAADAPAARISELNESGAKAYAERNYRTAIEKFVEAYAIDHDPNLLFNIARCYEKLGDAAAAIEKYEAFIAAPGADTEGRLKAKASLRELRELERQGGASSATASDATPEPDGPSPDPAAPSSSSSPRLWPWLALGGGIVVTGVGATFYVLGVRDHDQVTHAPGYADGNAVHPMTRAEAQSYVASGDRKKLVGGIGLGIGGALLATAAVLFVSGGKSSKPAESATLELEPSPGGAFATYRGSF